MNMHLTAVQKRNHCSKLIFMSSKDRIFLRLEINVMDDSDRPGLHFDIRKAGPALTMLD